MQNLFNLISSLLVHSSCVIVPQLGGFVPNRRPAFIDELSHKVMPPSVQVLFNAKLSHNDGSFVEAWASRYSVSMEQAKVQIEEEVAAFLQQLRAAKHVNIPLFGNFSLVGNSIRFTSVSQCVPALESYGLTDIYCSPLLQEADKSVPSVLPKVMLSSAAVVLAVAVLFPLGVSQSNSNFASFLPFTAPATQVVTVHDTLYRYREVPAPVQKETPAPSATPAFHLVLSQFPSQNQADKFVSEFQPRLSDSLKVLPMGELFVVSCASTPNAAKATRMLEHVRSNSSFKKSFLLFQ